MIDLLPPWPLLSAFLVASLLLALTPGPGVLYIVTRTLVQGRPAGLVSVAAIALGNLANALAAAVGLATLFEISALAFTLVKHAGALYLLYLGLRMLRSSRSSPAPLPGVASTTPSLGRIFHEGLLVALLNPKTTLFFAAFLPQFIASGAHPSHQGVALGACFVLIAAATDALYALLAGSAAPALCSNRLRRLGYSLAGGIFIALGLFTALTGSRPSR